jgi:hypothetical protein
MNSDPITPRTVFRAHGITVEMSASDPSGPFITPARDVARECELEQRQEMAAKLIRRGKVTQALALLEGRSE